MDVWSHHFALQHHFCCTALSVNVDVDELNPNQNYGLVSILRNMLKEKVWTNA